MNTTQKSIKELVNANSQGLTIEDIATALGVAKAVVSSNIGLLVKGAEITRGEKEGKSLYFPKVVKQEKTKEKPKDKPKEKETKTDAPKEEEAKESDDKSTAEKIMEFVKKHPGATAMDIESNVGLSHAEAQKALEELVKDGKLNSETTKVGRLIRAQYEIATKVSAATQKKMDAPAKPAKPAKDKPKEKKASKPKVEKDVPVFKEGDKVKFHAYRDESVTFSGEVIAVTQFSNNKKTAYLVKTKDGNVQLKSPTSLTLVKK